MTFLLAVFMFSACYWWGTQLQQWAGWRDRNPAEHWVFATALGLACAGILYFLLALLGLAHPASGWVLLSLFFLCSVPRLGRDLAALGRRLRGLRPQLFQHLFGRGLDSFCLWTLGILIALGLILAQAPPARKDALVYHLAVPKAYLEAGGAVNLPNNKYSYLPMLTDMVYGWAMSLQFEPLPQVVGFGMALLLAAALTVFFRRRCAGRWPLLPAVLYLATPTFWEVSAQAYVDTQTALWAFLAFYAWDRWREREESRWFWRLAIFSAAALASKMTLFLLVPLVVLALALKGRRHSAGWVLARVALYGCVVLLVMAPWWARNYHFTGNPFMPWFLDIFGGADAVNWDSQRAHMEAFLVRHTGTGQTWEDYLALPYTVTFHSRPGGLPFDGDIGIVYLMLVPAWLWLPWRGRTAAAERVRAMAGLLFLYSVVWFLYFPGVRYLTVPFTLLAVGSAWGLTRLAPPGRGGAFLWNSIVGLVVAAGLLFNLTAIGDYWVRARPWDFLLGKETRDAYLSRRLAPYPVYRAMNRHLGPDDTALFVYMRNYGYLCEKRFIADSFFEAHTLQQMLKRNPSLPELAAALKRRGITHLMFDEDFTFGPDAAFTRKEQHLIAELLWWTGQWVAGQRGFYLYRIVLD